MPPISFFYQDTAFKIKHKQKIKEWITDTICKEKRVLKSLSYIFCSDSVLLDLNIRYLHHNTLTDIITFNLSENDNWIDGEIYISIDRIQENATKFRCSPEEELHRVIIHGVLHLVGYLDKTAIQRKEMRKRENFYLNKRFFLAKG